MDNSLGRNEVLIGMGVTALVLLVISKLILKFTGLDHLPVIFSWKSVGYGLALGIIITLLSRLLYQFWGNYRLSADFYLDAIIKPLTLLDLIWLGLLPGLSEELLFRGVLLPAFGLNWIGIAVTSVTFGILHLSSPEHWSYVVWATVVGVMFGYMAVETGNLLIPLVAHITTNLLSSYLWKLKVFT